LIRQHFIGLRLMPQWEKWCVSQCPDSFSRSKTYMVPKWSRGWENLRRYREVLRAGLREGGKKAMNMNKVKEILQKSDESPAQFYERWCEAYCLYSPFNTEAPENQWMVNVAFVGPAQGDIRRKLQKLKGFACMHHSF
jgi:hypothetical protein